mmetsp:Transcript_31835/g.71655  ORF Transcript_31835/g.71655 Transcript_31835/m.71655 type:complete len:338 (+) Transcript_31835:1187-2200(+)
MIRCGFILVDAHHHLLAAVDPPLLARRRLLDAKLSHATFDGLGHAPELLDFLDHLPGRRGQLRSQALHHVAPAPGVRHLGQRRLLLKDELGVARDAGAFVGGEPQGLVERVGVQALRPAHDGRHGLHRGAHHVVQRVLRRQRVPRRLAVGPEQEGLFLLRAELLPHELGPDHARGPELGHLHVKVHARPEEEAEPRRHVVHLEPRLEGRPHVLHAVRQSEGQLQLAVRARLLHVVAADGDGVVLGHPARGEGEDVLHDAHARPGGVDEGVPHHELFQNVVLDCPRELLGADPLLLGRHHVHGQHRQHGAVHRHAHRHLRNMIDFFFKHSKQSKPPSR